MNYNEFTFAFNTADKQRQAVLKKQYPHYYTNMMNRAWSVIAMIRARKKDTVVDNKEPIV